MQLQPGWNALFVTDWSGRYVDESGSSRKISNLEDRQTFLRLRKSADVIVTTAATVRQEKYTKVDYAPIYILSSSGDVPDSSLGEVLQIKEPIFDELTQRLQSDGHRVFFYEGGPRLFKHLEQTNQPATIWLTIVGEPQGGANSADVLEGLGFDQSWQLRNFYQDGPNLVSQWQRP